MYKDDPIKAESYCYIQGRKDYGNNLIPLLDDMFYFNWSDGFPFCDSYGDFIEEQIDDLKSGYYKVTYSYFMEDEYEEGYRVCSYPVIDKIDSFERSFFRGPLIAFKIRCISLVRDIKSLFTKNWVVEYDYKVIGYYSNRGYLPQTIWTRFFHTPDRCTGPCKISICRHYI